MQDYATYLPMMMSGFLGMLMMMAMFLVIPFYIFLYLVSDEPKKLLSGIFSFKFWALGILMLAVSVSGLLDKLIYTLGLRERMFDINMTDLRNNISMLLVGVLLIFLFRRYFPKSIIAIKKEDKKTPMSYVSHIFYLFFLGLLLILCLSLAAQVINYLLQFGIREYREKFYFVKFITDIFTLLIPVALLYFVCRSAIGGNKRYMPHVKSESGGIFVISAVWVLIISALMHVGALVNLLMKMMLKSPDILGPVQNADEIRWLIVGMIMTFGILCLFIWKTGGRKVFQKA